jgi:hypothetical protein
MIAKEGAALRDNRSRSLPSVDRALPWTERGSHHGGRGDVNLRTDGEGGTVHDAVASTTSLFVCD